jgi:vacuolar iron transporter family protein
MGEYKRTLLYVKQHIYNEYMLVKRYVEVGVSFGLTSGIITTLGLIVGLNAGESSKMVVLGGIVTVAIADALSDALGIHVSEESEHLYSDMHIWISTLATFVSKFLTSITFVIPVLLFPLDQAVIISVVWGLSFLSILNFFIAKIEKKNPVKVIVEHAVITLVVIFITNLVGTYIAQVFR